MRSIAHLRSPGLARPASAVWALAALLTLSTSSPAAFESPWPDARSAGLTAFGQLRAVDTSGGSGARWRVEFSAHELFGLTEARGFRATVARSGDAGSTVVELARFGSPVYEERVLGLSLARRAGDRAAVELGVRALGLAASGLSDEWAVAVDAGLRAALIGGVGVDCRFRNLGSASIGGSPVSSTCALAATLIAENLTLAVTTLAEPGVESPVSLGVEVALADGLDLRAGLSMRPSLFAAGLGVAVPGRVAGKGKVVLDVAWQWHPELGGSSFASVSLEL